MLMELKGVNGQLELHEDKVVIKREGLRAKLTQGLFKGDKTIYLNQISGIQVKAASTLVNGYIQFSLSGGNEGTRGIFQAGQDENSVMFDKKNNEIVTEIKSKIEELKANSNRMFVANTPISSADEIRKYKQLLDEGIISEEDFNNKKKELLGV